MAKLQDKRFVDAVHRICARLLQLLQPMTLLPAPASRLPQRLNTVGLVPLFRQHLLLVAGLESRSAGRGKGHNEMLKTRVWASTVLPSSIAFISLLFPRDASGVRSVQHEKGPKNTVGKRHGEDQLS